MMGGNWIPELIQMLHAESVLGEAGAHSPQLALETLLEADPDALMISPCGFRLEQTRENLPPLTENPNWSKLRAVKNGRVAIADGNELFNRPGPRVVEQLEALAEFLVPEAFPPKDCRHGKAWWYPLED